MSIDYQAFRDALEKAREDSRIDRLDLRRYDGMESQLVAWRGQDWAYIVLSSQLLERSPSLEMVATVCCKDLDAYLDEHRHVAA